MSSSSLRRVGRRHFLLGAGGVALSIPFLTSMERPARAGDPARKPRYFYLGTDHGGCYDASFFPSSATSMTATAVAGHTVSSGALKTSGSGGQTLSKVLSAAALSPALVQKMNVLRGLDVPCYIGHSTGQHLGNFARNDNNGDDGVALTAAGNRPTIDQIMAGSPGFYSAADGATTTQRSMVINSGRQLSWAFSNPAQGVASPVQNVQGLDSSLQLFNAVFGGAVNQPSSRPPVVDKVLASYKSLREGDARLSAADKVRLDTHMAMLSDLEKTLKAQVACTVPPTPGDDAVNYPNDPVTRGQLFADVIAAAFACGASRIGVYGFGDAAGFSEYMGSDWHKDVAHLWTSPDPQKWLTQAYQGVFENILVYLAAKLDQLDDGGGHTVLDNSLLVWSQESGMETHASYGVPVVTFGSGAGYFNTGLYCDYRKMDSAAVIAPIDGYNTYPGLLYQQWLATQLIAMGVTPAEFELWSDAQGKAEHGYGTPYLATESWYDWPNKHYKSLDSAYFQMASTPLPFLKA